MGGLLGQVLPLVGVALGAAATLVITSFMERSRRRHDLSIRWDAARLVAYVEFATTVKTIAHLASRLVAAQGVPAAELPLTPEEGLPLRDTASIAAAQQMNYAAWHLSSIAQATVTVDAGVWNAAFLRYRNARAGFYRSGRASMGVPPAEIPLGSWPTPATGPNWRRVAGIERAA
jgi:hypothetical protein